MTWLDGGGWGTREDAIPGEWALLVLCMVALALLGVAVFWFTRLRHDRAALGRTGAEPDEAGTFSIGELAQAEPEAELEAESESDSEAEIEPDPEIDVEPEPEAEPEPVKSSAASRLTEEIFERVELERARRKSVKWKELAALVEREFGVRVHPRAIERALRRRRAAVSAVKASDAASGAASDAASA